MLFYYYYYFILPFQLSFAKEGEKCNKKEDCNDDECCVRLLRFAPARCKKLKQKGEELPSKLVCYKIIGNLYTNINHICFLNFLKNVFQNWMQ